MHFARLVEQASATGFCDLFVYGAYTEFPREGANTKRDANLLFGQVKKLAERELWSSKIALCRSTTGQVNKDI